MKVVSVHSRGIGDPFKTTPLALDFSDIPPESIIAFRGRNGRGKSHAMDFLCPAPLFREHPSYRTPRAKRGAPIATHVPEDVTDAYVRTTYDVDGVGRVVVEVKINGATHKMEPFITVAGVTHGPGHAEVDELIAKHFASRGMMLIGPFACQGGHHGFFRAEQSERKQIFAEMIGAGLFQGRAQACAKRAKALSDELVRVREQIIVVGAKVARAEAIAVELETLAATLVTDAATVEAAMVAHQAAHAALAAARETLRTSATEAERVGAERTRLTTLRATLAQKITAAETKLAGLAVTLAGRADVEARAATLADAERRIRDAQAMEREQVEAVTAAEAKLATATAERAQLITAYRERDAEVATVTEAEARLGDAAAIAGWERDVTEQTAVVDETTAALATRDAAREELDAAATRATEAVAAHDAATPALEAAAATEAAAAATRATLEARLGDLAPQAALLGSVPGVPACATCPLTASAREVQPRLDALAGELAALPAPTEAGAELAAHKAARATLVAADRKADDALRLHDDARRALADRKDAAQVKLMVAQAALAARAEDRQVVANAATLRAALADVTERGKAAAAAAQAATTARDDAAGALARTRAHLATVEIEKTAAAEAQARMPGLAAAAEAQAATTAELATAREEDAAAATALAGLPTIDTSELEATVTAATTAEANAATLLAAAREALATHQQQRATLEGERRALGDPVAALADLEATADALATDIADWQVLERALLGVQALLIAAAGPEVSALANDLLETAGFGRFQVALTTTQPMAKGGVKEVFDARIFDAESGRDGTMGSGGEQALIETALRLATVIVNTHRSGKPCRTLFFDESTAALDDENAPRLPEMIRRALRLGQFHACFLISHQPDVWAQADVRYEFQAGRVEREDAPPVATSAPAEEAAAA